MLTKYTVIRFTCDYCGNVKSADFEEGNLPMFAKRSEKRDGRSARTMPRRFVRNARKEGGIYERQRPAAQRKLLSDQNH